MAPIHLTPLGDRSLLIQLGSSLDLQTNRLVRAVCARLEARPLPGVVEYVPAFASVAVHYDPARVPPDELPPGRRPAGPPRTPYARLAERVEAALEHLEEAPLPPPRTVEIPVRYGGPDGPDLEEVARQHVLSPADVVRLHASGDYLVYMIGFLPGFPYLGGLPDELVTPRRAEPRAVVPAGSVGIGGSQTGVYPLASPGGWQLIGRTPLRLFDAAREPPALLRPGDRVRFRPMSPDEIGAPEPPP